MSPEPYVRAQALVFAALCFASTVVGSALATLICVVVALAFFAALRVHYFVDRRRVRADADETPRHRERLDLIVAGDAYASLGVGLGASASALTMSNTARDLGIPSTSVTLLL